MPVTPTTPSASLTRERLGRDVQYECFQQAAVAKMIGALLEHIGDLPEDERVWSHELWEGLAVIARNIDRDCGAIGERVMDVAQGHGR